MLIDAATVVLLRPAGAAFEVLLVRRHRGMSFMGGASVFPGGKLDQGDTDPGLLERLSGDAVSGRLEPTPGQTLSPVQARGLVVAALRELFEEVGVLLARRGGVPVAAADPAWPALRQDQRALEARQRTFAAVLSAHELSLDAAGLHYFAHWVTPSFEPKRFDARFFWTLLPEGQKVDLGGTEHTEATWFAPAAALAAHGRGELRLPPPTYVTLETLAVVPSLDTLLGAPAPPVRAILPKVAAVGELAAVLLPWDPAHAAAEGDSLAVSHADSPLAARTSRFVLRGELWHAERG